MGFRSMDLHAVSNLYMEQGMAAHLTSKSLHDPSKDFPPHEYMGHWVRLRGGSNDDAIVVIEDNDEHTLFFEQELANAPSGQPDTSYFIYEHMHRDAWEAETLQALRDIKSNQEELALYLRQIRRGLSILSNTDLEQVDK